MKKILMSGAGAVALATVLSGTVQAADLYTPAPVVSAPAGWSGVYFGVDIGYGDANTGGTFVPSELPGDPWSNDDGVVGGGHIGYNWEMDSFVFGIEGDVMATGFTSKACSECVNGSETAVAETDMLASLRGRLGMSLNDTSLLYVTGGLAYRDGKWFASGSALGQASDTDADGFDRVGAVVGGGFEWKSSETISVRLEGLYYMFDTIRSDRDYPSCTDLPDAECPGPSFKSNPFVVRVGASVGF